MMVTQTVGWIGSLCLAFCGLPQAIQSYRQGNSKGVNLGFLVLWLTGEIFTLVYVFTSLTSLQLMVNYTVNLICVLVIMFYKLFGTED